MAEATAIVERAVRDTLKQLEEYAPKEFAKLTADPRRKMALTEAARDLATEHVKLAREFHGQPKDIANRLARHLSEHRIKMIREAFDFKTFRMDISKRDDGNHWVEITREGKHLFSGPKVVVESAHIEWSKLLQYASVIIEAIMLVMSIVGISVSTSFKVVDKAIEETVQAIKSSSKLQRALDDFIVAWEKAGNSAYQKAKAVFLLIEKSYALDVLWTAIGTICSEMTWHDWLLKSAQVTAMIIAALATEGAALIAEIALIILESVDFGRKIANLIHLDRIKAELC